mmetsp:Transcript_40981/g.103239  ORF Transcript_40981/g.103239 Transcript_40981/m.103239 type:complete len:138 (-) Transcript_40981:1720-2133(-)
MTECPSVVPTTLHPVVLFTTATRSSSLDVLSVFHPRFCRHLSFRFSLACSCALTACSLLGCYAWCCPHCALASARSAYDGSNCCFNFCCGSGAMLYNIIREGYGISGTCCGDICYACFCQCCIAIQATHEVAVRGRK